VQQFTVALVAVATLAASPSRAAEPTSLEALDGVRLGESFGASMLRRAVRGAAGRLADSSCAAVLDEFRDEEGRPLRERLRALSLDAPEYALQVLFYDGANDPPCRRNHRLQAHTMPGSRVVRICPSLLTLALTDPDRAEAVVIHEVLHTLGLGENPPSEREITAGVLRRCRR